MRDLHDKLLGLGVYTLQEASFYSKVPSQRLSSWVFGSSRYTPVINSELIGERLVSFHDLVQAMAINKAREYHVSLQKIREAIRRAEKEFNISLPLAHQHKLVLFEKDLHIKLSDDQIIQLTGRGRDQSMIVPIIEPFMKDLCFSEEGLAISYVAFKKRGKKIILDPQRQFGQPLVEGTGYRADVLANAFDVEGSADIVADEFNVAIEDVRVAVSYIRSLRVAA